MSLGTYLEHGNDNSNTTNNAGGPAYKLDKWAVLRRFLVLGTEGGTYYAGEHEHTKQGLETVKACLAEDGERFVMKVVEVSTAGLAPKNDQAIYALALAAKTGDEKTRELAFENVSAVCRTGTHLFQFVAALKSLGGAGGRGAKRAISKWYLFRKPESLAYQLIKYRSRRASEGDKTPWTHRDVLRIARPTPPADEAKKVLLNYAVKGWPDIGAEPHPMKGPDLVWAFEKAQRSKDEKEVARLVADYRLPWEAVPSELLNSQHVWMALLPHLGLEAVTRNLGRLTANCVIAPNSDGERLVVSRFSKESVLESRLHPLKVAIAGKTYAQGHGMRGELQWAPSQAVNRVLNQAYFDAFGNVERTGKRFVFGIDISGSMGSLVSNTFLTCSEAAAILALVTAKVEPFAFLGGFDTDFLDLSRPLTAASWAGIRSSKGSIHADMPFVEAAARINNINAGGTDCAVPMAWAEKNKVPADVFVVLTDNETNRGRENPSVALRRYRSRMGINAKLVVVGMTATNFTIADPNDRGMLDVAGFSTEVPQVLSTFVSQE